MRRRRGPQRSSGAVGDPSRARPQQSLHLHFLRRPAAAHALLPEQRLRLGLHHEEASPSYRGPVRVDDHPL